MLKDFIAKVRAVMPSSLAPAISALGDAYKNAGKYEEACAEFAEAEKYVIDPEGQGAKMLAYICMTRADVEMERRNYEASLDLYTVRLPPPICFRFCNILLHFSLVISRSPI